MKILKKIIILMLICGLFSVFFSINITFAKDISDIESDASGFIQAGKEAAEGKGGGLTSVTGAVTENFTGLGQLLTMIGGGVLVAVIAYMGIKYLISPPDKQAALKQQLIGVVVAGIVIFGAYGIWSAVISVVSNF